jgi:hypothetical protein
MLPLRCRRWRVHSKDGEEYLPVMYAAQMLLTLRMDLLINLNFDEGLTKLFAFEPITSISVGLNIAASINSDQAATAVRNAAAVIATMSLLRSIGTGISIVVGGAMFQKTVRGRN